MPSPSSTSRTVGVGGPLVVGGSRGRRSAASTTSRTRAPGGQRVALGQVGQVQPAEPADPAAVRGADAGEDVQQRGLAAAVEPDHADPVAARDAQRHRVQQHPGRVAGHVRGDRLQVDQVLAIARGHQACSGGQDGQRRRPGRGRLVLVDDPGTGHRPVRQPDRAADAHPGQLGGHLDRGVGVGAEERAGRAGAGDDAGERPGVHPGAQGAPQVRGHADRGRLQVVAQGQGRAAAGRRRRCASSTGSTGRSGGGRAVAQPVQLAEHARGGQPAAVQRDHPVLRVPGQHRDDPLAAAGAQRGAAVQRERDVAAQLRRPARPARRGSGPASTARTARPARRRRRRCRRPCRRPPGCPCAAPAARPAPARRARPAAARPARPGWSRRPAPRTTPSPCTWMSGSSLADTVTSSNRLTAWKTVTRSW